MLIDIVAVRFSNISKTVCQKMFDLSNLAALCLSWRKQHEEVRRIISAFSRKAKATNGGTGNHRGNLIKIWSDLAITHFLAP